MGKYMKKSKITSDVAVMEVSPQFSLGVRTRAKTLALQRLQSPYPDASSFSYLQLRSRRLEKPPHQVSGKHLESRSRLNPKAPSSMLGLSLADSGSICCEEERENSGFGGIGDLGDKMEKSETEDLAGIEASLGENNLDFDGRERGTRESTPCSYIRDSNAIGTPGSTTRRSGSTTANQRLRNDVHRDIPTSHEMEEFFAIAEQHQQRMFMEKYNFDVVNDLPLPGRYDWVQLTP